MNDLTVIKRNPLEDTKPEIPRILFESEIKSEKKLGEWGTLLRSPWEHARQAVYEWVKPRMNKVLTYDDVLTLCRQMESMIQQAIHEERKEAFRTAARVAYERLREK